MEERKRTVWIWELFGFAITSLCGTLLHFAYDLLDGAIWIAPFSGVNESTWEHIKLMFWPMLAFAVAESFFFRGYESFWCVKLGGILLGMSLIPIFFYTYNGVIGKSPDWINIAIFFISAAIAYYYETRALVQNNASCKKPILPIVTIAILGLCFVIFTFLPPEIGLFRDPITGDFGIQG